MILSNVSKKSAPRLKIYLETKGFFDFSLFQNLNSMNIPYMKETCGKKKHVFFFHFFTDSIGLLFPGQPVGRLE